MKKKKKKRLHKKHIRRRKKYPKFNNISKKEPQPHFAKIRLLMHTFTGGSAEHFLNCLFLSLTELLLFKLKAY